MYLPQYIRRFKKAKVFRQAMAQEWPLNATKGEHWKDMLRATDLEDVHQRNGKTVCQKTVTNNETI